MTCQNNQPKHVNADTDYEIAELIRGMMAKKHNVDDPECSNCSRRGFCNHDATFDICFNYVKIQV